MSHFPVHSSNSFRRSVKDITFQLKSNKNPMIHKEAITSPVKKFVYKFPVH